MIDIGRRKVELGADQGSILGKTGARRSRRPYIGSLAVICAAAALVVTGCGGSSSNNSNLASGKASFYTGWTPGGTPVRGGTVTIDSAEAVSTFDPYDGASPAEPLIYQVLDQLFELMPGPTSSSEPVLEPALVSSWSVSPDHLTYTFHIREGVKFSNGESLTGEDVVFSLKKIGSPLDSAATYTKQWKKISLVNPMTVQLQLRKPQPTLTEVLDCYQMSIVPKKVYEREGGKAFGLHPIGTGAFVFKSATPGFTKVTLVRNPHYWRAGQPYLNELVWNQVESDNARILAVRSGAATLAEGIPYAQVAALKSTPGVRMLVGPEWGAADNVFNRAKAPFNEINVVKALLYATPREQIIKSVYDGLGTPSNSLWGKLRYWDPKVALYPYDIAKAKELLKHSSVPNGFSMTINVSGGETEGELLASILQSSWAKIGVHANVQTLAPTTLDTNFFSGKFDFVVFPPEVGFSDFVGPNEAFSFYIDNHEPGWAPPANSKILAAFEKASFSTNEEEKAKLWRKVQYATYWEEPLAMPIVNLVSLNLASDSLHGFQVLPSTYLRMERAWVQK